MTRHINRSIVVALAVALCAGRAAAQDFKVIVHPGVAASDIASADLAKIFLKQSSQFPGGGAVVPVDQGKASAARAAFTQKVLGKSVGAIDTYWQQQIFSGKDVPPVAKSNDDEVVAFVKATPNAIGYVASGAAAGGVKVLAVK